VVTFVYIEKLRKDREEAARSANGGGIVLPRIGPERFRVQVQHFDYVHSEDSEDELHGTVLRPVLQQSKDV